MFKEFYDEFTGNGSNDQKEFKVYPDLFFFLNLHPYTDIPPGLYKRQNTFAD